jgi:DNA-binding IclR family transcriptional regulator
VAAPIRDAGGQVVAAVSFSVPAFRFKEREDEYTEGILEAAERISAAMPGRDRLQATGLSTSYG